MKHIILVAALMGVVVVAAPSLARAQARPFKIGVAGGLSVPTGDTGDGLKSGFVLTGNIDFKPVLFPFRLQAEVGWNQWGAKDTPGNTDGNLHIVNVSGNVVYDFKTLTPVKPYVLGTAGWYHVTGEASVGNTTISTSDNKLGLGGGIGLRLQLSTLDTYVEARYAHVVDTDINFVPITFGIRF